MNRAGTLKHDLNEINFALYLDELYGIDVTQGDTTLAIRKDRARDLILKHGAADRVVAKGQTLAQAFAKVYGEPLHFLCIRNTTNEQQHENGDGV